MLGLDSSMDREEFIRRITEVSNEIINRQAKGRKFIYDAFGRMYVYDTDEDLQKIWAYISKDKALMKVTKQLAHELL